MANFTFKCKIKFSFLSPDSGEKIARGIVMHWQTFVFQSQHWGKGDERNAQESLDFNAIFFSYYKRLIVTLVLDFLVPINHHHNHNHHDDDDDS